MQFLVLLIFITGCQLIIEPKDFSRSVPGIYTRYSEHEFGIEYDTLVIEVLSKEDQYFTIERRWEYQRVLDGKNLIPDYKIIKNTGKYFPEHNELMVNETGECYYINFQQKTILTRSIQYQKLCFTKRY